MNLSSLRCIDDMDLTGKRVLIREDFNVPINGRGEVINSERIERALPTIHAALAKNARVMLVSHLGQPTEGASDEAFSLAPVARVLSELLSKDVPLIKDWINGVEVAEGQVVLCENVRFLKGETTNDVALAKKMAQLCDVFVMDAFATAHRANASTVGIAHHAPKTCAGPLMMEELTALSEAWQNPKRPLVAVIGGAKISTKIRLIENLLSQVNGLIVGGGIANTFLKAKGLSVGKSLYEPDWVKKAEMLITLAEKNNVKLPLPTDVVVAKSIDDSSRMCPVNEVNESESIFDIGSDTIRGYAELIRDAGTVIWNGPLGVFERAAFSRGTESLAKAIVASNAYSVIGGGDTIAAAAKAVRLERFGYVSTGGGAFLAFLEGSELPAVEALCKA